ncbi:MAG: sulfite exporter TauE/SafE family protein [Ferruginibacter sp.]|nr:sulfite exporter TauE/SafE family protein [Ferruginibacter sp.]
MTALLFTALTLGMLGSFHCIGMCGPLAFSLPLSSSSDFAKFTGSLLYNVGRVVTYSCLGLLFGLAGKSFSLFGMQQWLSVIAGAAILLFIFIPAKWMARMGTNNLISRYLFAVRSALGKLFLQRNYRSLFAIGLLNGLLPCGLIYMAVAGAIATADPFKSAFFMAAFGLGTLPVMWSVSFFGNYMGISIRKKIRSSYPVMMALMACLLIVRGMGLGIPYLSPSTNKKTPEVQICHPVVQNSSLHVKNTNYERF